MSELNKPLNDLPPLSRPTGFVTAANYADLQESMRLLRGKFEDQKRKITELMIDAAAGTAIVESILAAEERIDELEIGLSQIASMVTDESGHNMQKVGAIARNLLHTKNENS